jgi:calcineurin-like phosphoesterase
MTGPRDSVIGVRKELVISRFLNHMPNRFEVADGPSIFSAVVVDVEPGGRATHIERLQFVI